MGKYLIYINEKINMHNIHNIFFDLWLIILADYNNVLLNAMLYCNYVILCGSNL